LKNRPKLIITSILPAKFPKRNKKRPKPWQEEFTGVIAVETFHFNLHPAHRNPTFIPLFLAKNNARRL
jgi:hypothetical protein